MKKLIAITTIIALCVIILVSCAGVEENTNALTEVSETKQSIVTDDATIINEEQTTVPESDTEAATETELDINTKDDLDSVVDTTTEEIPETDLTNTDTDLSDTETPDTEDLVTEPPVTDNPETTDCETEASETDRSETDVPETDPPETDAPETDPPETTTPVIPDVYIVTDDAIIEEGLSGKEPQIAQDVIDYLKKDVRRAKITYAWFATEWEYDPDGNSRHRVDSPVIIYSVTELDEYGNDTDKDFNVYFHTETKQIWTEYYAFEIAEAINKLILKDLHNPDVYSEVYIYNSEVGTGCGLPVNIKTKEALYGYIMSEDVFEKNLYQIRYYAAGWVSKFDSTAISEEDVDKLIDKYKLNSVDIYTVQDDVMQLDEPFSEDEIVSEIHCG